MEDTAPKGWDKLRKQHCNNVEEKYSADRKRRGALTPGELLIKNVLYRRRWIRRKQNCAEVVHTCASNKTLSNVVNCTAGVAIFALLLLFVVFIIAMANLNEAGAHALYEDKRYTYVVIGAFAVCGVSWFLFLGMLFFQNCVVDMEIDPDEVEAV